MSDKEIKAYSAEIYRIASTLWANEIGSKYTGTQTAWRDWLNEKTGLNVDQINYAQREAALKAWIDVLITLEAQG